MMFSYRYDQRLKPRIKSKGLYMGDWVHQLLEEHYHGRDWEKKFAELKKGWDKLFDEEREHYEEKGFTPPLVFNLMSHYIEHWEADEKKWKLLEVEKAYAIKTKFGFPVRWKSDLLIQDGKSIALVETKAKKKIPESDERILSGQVHAYCYLLLKVAGIKVDKIIWNYIRTEPVPKPKILKSGSLSERKINTDRRTYLLALKEAKIHPKGEEIVGLENFLKSLPDTLSLERVTNTVNLKVGELFVRDWVERHRRAQSIKRPLRTFVRNCKWDCDYYGLCLADMKGDVDREMIIKKDFVRIGEVKNG
jgi:hypothetical protein